MTELAALNVSIRGDASNLSAAIRTANDQLTSFGRVTSAAEAKARGFDGALSKTAKSLTDAQKSANSFAGVLDDVNTSAAASAAAFMQFERSAAAVDQLRASIDPMFAASKRYEAAIEQLNIALQQGVISQRQYEAMTERVGNAFLGAGHAAAPMYGAMGRVGQAMSGARGQIQNVSWQLQDVAVQLQAGTSASVVFAQQGSQIASAFGPVGAALGAVIALTPLLVLGLGDAWAKAQTLEERMDALSEAVNRYVSSSKEARQTSAELAAEYGNLATQAQAALTAIAAAERLAAIQALNQEVATLAATFGTFEGAVDGLIGSNLETTLFNIRNELNVTGEAAVRIQKALEALSQARGPEAVASAAARLRKELIDAGVAANSQLVVGLNNAEKAAIRLAAETQRSAVSADQLASNMAGAYAVYAQTRSMATELANETARAAQAAQSLAAYNAELSMTGQSSGPDAARSLVQFGGPVAMQPSGAGMAYRAPAGGGGGGGGAGRDFEGELAAFQEGLATEVELEAAQYEQRQTLLQEFLDARVLTLEEYQAYMEQIKMDHEARIGEIEAEAYQRRLSQTADLFGALAGIAQAGGQRMVKAVAALQAIEGTINAYGAAIKALNTPGISLAGRFAAYASVLAAGLKGVAAIRSAGGIGGGSGGGGSVGSAGGATQAAAQGPLQVSLNTFGAGDLINRADLGNLLDRLNREAGDRGYTILSAPA